GGADPNPPGGREGHGIRGSYPRPPPHTRKVDRAGGGRPNVCQPTAADDRVRRNETGGAHPLWRLPGAPGGRGNPAGGRETRGGGEEARTKFEADEGAGGSDA